MTTTASSNHSASHPHFASFPKPDHANPHDHTSPYKHDHTADQSSPAAPPGYHKPSHASTDPTPLSHSHSNPIHLPSHAHAHTHAHIATPHPMASTLGYLDAHVPAFAKHHKEYTVQHDFRRAKRDARQSLDSPIPELAESETDEQHHQRLSEEEERRRIAEMLERERIEKEEQRRRTAEMGRAKWEEVVREREAARKRSGAFEDGEGGEGL